MRILAIIPARYGSTRFPGKALAPLHGKPMIQWVWEQATQAQTVSRVLVATDDRRIARAVARFGGEAVLTSQHHRSGTDRIAEALGRSRCDLVVNVQGDEPLLPPANIDLAVRALVRAPHFHIATLCRPIQSEADLASPHVVKVVRALDGAALYFSRFSIPYDRDQTGVIRLKHIGLYVYRPTALRQMVRWRPSPLEQFENLEQLRALEHGLRILAVETPHDSHGVDTPEDLDRVARQMRARAQAV